MIINTLKVERILNWMGTLSKLKNNNILHLTISSPFQLLQPTVQNGLLPFGAYAGLSPLTQLRTLKIPKTQPTFDSVQSNYLISLTNLTDLTISGCEMNRDTVRNNFQGLTNLTALDINFSNLSICDLPPTLVNLRTLCLQHNSKNTSGQDSLAYLTGLTSLSMNFCPRNVSQITSLTFLDVGITSYTSHFPGQFDFGCFPKLKYLNVSVCYSVDDESLLTLMTVQGLKELHILWLRTRDATKEALKQAFPDLRIISNYTEARRK